MTLDDLKKLVGKQIEVAGSSGAEFQCVDLANYYIKNILGLPIIEWTDAKDFLKKADSNYLPLCNTPLFVPQAGDIAVWSGNVGSGHGHIAVVLEANVNSFKSIDQNWSKPLHVSLETHNYSNVIGFLRKKGSNEALDACMKDREKFWKERDESKKELYALEQIHKKLEEELVKKEGSWVALEDSLRTEILKLEEKVKNLEVELAKEDNSNPEYEVLKQRVKLLELQLKKLIDPKKTTIWEFIKLKWG